jgi:aspartyl-tRNA(Asn)/glutamyl-tRNA(Gln) amidotransferase subunit A
VLLAEASAAVEPHLSRRELFAAEALALFDQGRVLPATMYVQAHRLRARFVDSLRTLWRQVDCLVTPATPTTAPLIGATTIDVGGTSEDVRLATTRFARAFDLLGLPALSLPCGTDSLGLPVGLQIVAPAFSERSLLHIGAALESPLRNG